MSDPKLNPKVYELGVEQVPIRKGFGEGLVVAGERNDKVVGLCADLTESTQMLAFKNKFPNRYVQIGVAEQNLAAVASGLAAMGKTPFITPYAMFSPGRNWEQIKTTICYNDRPVKIIGSHAGVSVGPDGGTHQAIEDIAITRVIPRMQVIVPCDLIEAKKATIAIAETSSPTYLRLAREKTPVVTTEESPFKIGQGNVLVDSKKPTVAIFACGPMVYNALIAAKKLLKESIEVSVINLHTIKPLDITLIELMAKKAGAILTVEEHQKRGGMGSAVAEFVVENCPVPMTLMGVNDEFGQSGTQLELIEHYGLGIDSIVKSAKELVKRK